MIDPAAWGVVVALFVGLGVTVAAIVLLFGVLRLMRGRPAAPAPDVPLQRVAEPETAVPDEQEARRIQA